MKKTKYLLITLSILAACSNKESENVAQDNRVTLTQLTEIHFAKPSSIHFIPSAPVSITLHPEVLIDKHLCENIIEHEGFLYFYSKQGIMRYDLSKKTSSLYIPLNLNANAWFKIKYNKLALVTYHGKTQVYNLTTKALLLDQNIDMAVNTAPVIDQNNVIIQTASNIVFCFDCASGKENWVYHSLPGVGLERGSSPIISGQYFITGFTNGDFSVINKNNGLLQWNDSLSNQISVFGSDIIHVAAKPIISGKHIYAVGLGENLSAYELDTGKVLWTKKIGSAHDLIENGDNLYVLDTKGRVIILRKDSGIVLAIYDVASQLDHPQNFSNMLVVNDQIMLTTIQKRRPVFENIAPVAAFLNPKTGTLSKVITLPKQAKDLALVKNQLLLLTDKKIYALGH